MSEKDKETGSLSLFFTSVTRRWKKTPKFSKSCQSTLTYKVLFFKIAKNATKYLGYVCKKMCRQEL